MIDVSADIEIAASPSTIAGVMFDPQRYTEWMTGVSRVEMLDPALAPGARVKHHGTFMGQDIVWTTQVEAVHFPHVLTLLITDGPFVGTTRIGIQRSPGGSQVKVHTTGALNGMPFVPDAMVATPMKAGLVADLERLRPLVQA